MSYKLVILEQVERTGLSGTAHGKQSVNLARVHDQLKSQNLYTRIFLGSVWCLPTCSCPHAVLFLKTHNTFWPLSNYTTNKFLQKKNQEKRGSHFENYIAMFSYLWIKQLQTKAHDHFLEVKNSKKKPMFFFFFLLKSCFMCAFSMWCVQKQCILLVQTKQETDLVQRNNCTRSLQSANWLHPEPTKIVRSYHFANHTDTLPAMRGKLKNMQQNVWELFFLCVCLKCCAPWKVTLVTKFTVINDGVDRK